MTVKWCLLDATDSLSSGTHCPLSAGHGSRTEPVSIPAGVNGEEPRASDSGWLPGEGELVFSSGMWLVEGPTSTSMHTRAAPTELHGL